MLLRTGKNCIVTREIFETEGDCDHFDEGERVVVVDISTTLPYHAYVVNRIGNEGWVNVDFLRPARGRRLKVRV